MNKRGFGVTALVIIIAAIVVVGGVAVISNGLIQFSPRGNPQLADLAIKCTDTDVTPEYPDGINPFEQGRTCLINQEQCSKDKCGGSLSFPGLKEYYCDGNKIRSVNLNCEFGCVNGACLTEPDIPDFIEICTPADLDNVRNNLLGNYLQVCDIDLSTWGEFEPIGAENDEFFGTYDGDIYTIYNFAFNDPNRDYVGIFGKIIGGAVIKNVRLENVNVVGRQNVGALVGHSFISSIEGSSVIGGTVDGTLQWVGGLIGHAHPGTTMSGLSVESVTVSGPSKVGGLVGNHHGSILDNSYATGNANGDEFVGGLIGYMQEGPFDTVVTNSHATGDANGADAVGGLVGWVEHNDQPGIKALIDNSHATGSVTGTGKWTGGLVGYLGRHDIITNSYATGNVNGVIYTGGLAGYLNVSEVDESFATGSVSGNNYTGGLVGYQTGFQTFKSLVKNSHATGAVDGVIYTGGLSGYVNIGTITNSHATGNVDVFGTGDILDQDGYYGGLVGYLISSEIENSSATGAVTGVGAVLYGGGLVGYMTSFPSGSTINNSYAIGPIANTGSGYSIGGLIGSATGNTIIENSYATGSVTTNSSIGIAGGFAGSSSGYIINSYSTGFVSGEINGTSLGGFFGTNTLPFFTTNSYWDINTSGQTEGCGGSGFCEGTTGLPTAQMQMQSTYEPEWDFETVWGIDEGVSYPFLQWQGGPI